MPESHAADLIREVDDAPTIESMADVELEEAGQTSSPPRLEREEPSLHRIAVEGVCQHPRDGIQSPPFEGDQRVDPGLTHQTDTTTSCSTPPGGS